MCQLTEYTPHRETEPVRFCADCGCLLTSVNETERCWAHGGWLELASWWDQSESFASLMAEESVLA